MPSRFILVAVALCVAGLFFVPGLSGTRAAGKPLVSEAARACAPAAAGDSRVARETVLSAFGKLPLYFVENRGVYPDEVAFTIQGADKTLFFTPAGITFRLKGEDRAWVVKLEFVGAEDVAPRGEDRQEAVFSYFKGPRKDWKTGLRTYARVVYENLWPGIDLVYRGTMNRLKYEFLVKPGADPAKIRLRYRGVASIERTASGALAVKTSAGGFEDAPPEAWQEIDGKRVPVGMDYRLDGGESGDAASACDAASTREAASTRDQASTRDTASTHGEDGRSFGFRVGEYDATRPLVLDPAILVYCGYLGGIGDDYSYGIAADMAGNVYVTGTTNSSERTFPVLVGPDLTHSCWYTDTFVAKVNASGTRLVYCGYIGGSGDESGSGIAVDGSGHAYVTGWTASTEQSFPVTVGPDLTYNGGSYDAFVAKVTASGTGLVYCGYIGGSGIESGSGIAVDGSGNAYVAGETYSAEQTFPVTVGPDLTHNGGLSDAFVAKLAASGSSLLYCGYIGGSIGDFGSGIAIDGSGNAYVTGTTGSTEQTFPVAMGPDLTFNGGADAFVAKVNATGTGLVYCGYIGGSIGDFGSGIAIDGSGNAYVTGTTGSTEQTFPVAMGPDLTFNGGADAFVAKVNATGTGLVYCGYIGGRGLDWGYAITVDGLGRAHVTGETQSTEQTFPVLSGPDVTYNGGRGDAFVAKVAATGAGLAYCGYIGGSSDDFGRGIAVDGAGNAYVTGETQSTEQTFPVTSGPDLTHNGASDAFVARIAGTVLVGSGSPAPGGQVNLSLSSAGEAGLVYQLGSSFGNGPMIIGGLRLELSPDPLLFTSVFGAAPWIFQNYTGVLDAQGQATAAIQIPNLPALRNTRIYTAFVTLSASAPSGIASISSPFVFTIQ